MSKTTEETERRHQEFWVVSETTNWPVRATGYECPGQDYWWFPNIGLSIPASQCYDDAETAAASAIRRLEAERRKIEDQLIKLRERF